MRIGNRLLGDENPCFIIAEIGVNHNGNVELAKKMIRAAKSCKVDAVKFQNWITDEIVTQKVAKPKYQRGSDKTQYEMLKKLELSEEDFEELYDYTKKLGLVFLSTAEGKRCIDFLEKLNVPAYKVGSPDLTNFPDLTYIAKKGKPIILSTGMATMDEVREAVEVIKNAGNNQIILLHCTTNYPTKLEDVNMRAMLSMKKEFNLPIGYSDHTQGMMTSLMAVSLGAIIIEKHFTINKNLEGPDHKSSLIPSEMKLMVKRIRDVETILGSPIKKPVDSEKEMIRLMRKYIVAKKDIPKDTVITEDMLTIKRSDLIE